MQDTRSLVQYIGSIVLTNKTINQTNNTINNKTEDSHSESSTVKPFKNSRDVSEYFRKKPRDLFRLLFSSYGMDERE